MAKWIVQFEGKLIVEADDEKMAKETANVFLVGKGLSGAAAKTYGTEKLDEVMIVSLPGKKAVDINALFSA